MDKILMWYFGILKFVLFSNFVSLGGFGFILLFYLEKNLYLSFSVLFICFVLLNGNVLLEFLFCRIYFVFV